MAKITTSWKTLFEYASALGKARIRYNESPTEENKALLDEAKKLHDWYMDLCLESDEMINLPDFRY